MQDFEGALVQFGDVGDVQSLENEAFASPVDVVVSCLASRTGGKVNNSFNYAEGLIMFPICSCL